MLEVKKAKLFLVTSMILVLSVCILLASALEAAPKIYVDPVSIPLNGVTNIHIQAYDPPGNDPKVPDDFLYILVHQVVVRYPASGYTEEYMLGTASAPGIAGQKIRVDYNEDVAIPYGPGGSPITIDGNTYYWWRTRKGGNPVWPNERVDQVPVPSPTGWLGEYVADVEGRAYYGTSEHEIRLSKYFNIPGRFVVPEFGLTVAAVSLFAYWALYLRKRKS